MRKLVKSWRNGRDADGKYVPFTARIHWYEGEGDSSESVGFFGLPIRLRLEDSERRVNIYPQTREAAEQIWWMFRQQAAPPPGDPTPCVQTLLDLIKDRLPVTIP